MTGGPQPLHLTCTGDSVGGSLAVLCGTWAALQYGETNVNVITFNAAWSGFSPAFSWAFQRLVTLIYLWPFAGASVPGVNAATPSPEAAAAVSQMITPQNLQQAITVPGVPQGDLSPSAKGSEPVRAPGDPCPVLLCKLNPWVIGACFWFEDPNSYPIPPTLNTVTLYGTPGTGQALIVGYDASTDTAAFIWAGTDSNLDWLSNALFFDKEPFTPNQRLNQLIPGVEVHRGFLDLFIQQASGAQQPLENVTASLSGARQPTRVVAAGRSLGGALAALSAVWASTIWPSASVLLATSGQPRVGNAAWAQLVQATVGTNYQYVYERDIVPSTPAGFDYTDVPGGKMWITGGAILMQDRPEMSLLDLSWEDHNCDTKYVPALQSIPTVSVPAWVNAG